MRPTEVPLPVLIPSKEPNPTRKTALSRALFAAGIFIAFIAGSYASYAQRNDKVQLDCAASADEGCTVTQPGGESAGLMTSASDENAETCQWPVAAWL